MIASLSQKLEIRFWDLVITMLTRSQVVRSTLQWLMGIYQNEGLMRKIAIVLIIAFAGFATGILAFTITSLFLQ